MTRLEAALLEVCAILDDLRLPYMLPERGRPASLASL
jgi:hypothetical protein